MSTTTLPAPLPTPMAKKYSPTFDMLVDDIDGENVPGKRTLIQIGDRIIDLPNAWLRKRTPGGKRKKEEKTTTRE